MQQLQLTKCLPHLHFIHIVSGRPQWRACAGANAKSRGAPAVGRAWRILPGPWGGGAPGVLSIVPQFDRARQLAACGVADVVICRATRMRQLSSRNTTVATVVLRELGS
jgi:hypothetical protein